MYIAIGYVTEINCCVKRRETTSDRCLLLSAKKEGYEEIYGTFEARHTAWFTISRDISSDASLSIISALSYIFRLSGSCDNSTLRMTGDSSCVTCEIYIVIRDPNSKDVYEQCVYVINCERECCLECLRRIRAYTSHSTNHGECNSSIHSSISILIHKKKTR